MREYCEGSQRRAGNAVIARVTARSEATIYSTHFILSPPSPPPLANAPHSPNKNQADKAVVAPVRPKPIWFGGTGAIQAEWGALEEFAKSKTLRKDLEALKEKGRYSVYIATVEGLLSASMRVQADIETTQLMERLWRQMVVTCNAFGVRCLEQKKYPKALELLERAQDLAGERQRGAKRRAGNAFIPYVIRVR